MEPTHENEGYFTYALAKRMLGVGDIVMGRLIDSGELPFTEHPIDKRRKLFRPSDINRLRGSEFFADSSIHYTVATWLIYALIDPRDETIRYVGRTIRTKQRLQQHL